MIKMIVGGMIQTTLTAASGVGSMPVLAHSAYELKSSLKLYVINRLGAYKSPGGL